VEGAPDPSDGANRGPRDESRVEGALFHTETIERASVDGSEYSKGEGVCARDGSLSRARIVDAPPEFDQNGDTPIADGTA
jgi:hypothetical protein